MPGDRTGKREPTLLLVPSSEFSAEFAKTHSTNTYDTAAADRRAGHPGQSGVRSRPFVQASKYLTSGFFPAEQIVAGQFRHLIRRADSVGASNWAPPPSSTPRWQFAYVRAHAAAASPLLSHDRLGAHTGCCCCCYGCSGAIAVALTKAVTSQRPPRPLGVQILGSQMFVGKQREGTKARAHKGSREQTQREIPPTGDPSSGLRPRQLNRKGVRARLGFRGASTLPAYGFAPLRRRHAHFSAFRFLSIASTMGRRRTVQPGELYKQKIP
uniref:Uncharacterized protein n=1 Tax=Trichuris muris TaxID=70415 RepID=A0A5S6QCE7_TRIMR